MSRPALEVADTFRGHGPAWRQANDFALMQALKSALQQRDPGAHIFFAPEAMRAGGFWQLADEVPGPVG